MANLAILYPILGHKICWTMGYVVWRFAGLWVMLYKDLLGLLVIFYEYLLVYGSCYMKICWDMGVVLYEDLLGYGSCYIKICWAMGHVI